jgi:trehalose 6-phosphate phosphatase
MPERTTPNVPQFTASSTPPIARFPTPPTSSSAHLTMPPPLPSQGALFLDLDGTLAPIMRRPELVRVPRETVELLRELHVYLNGAIAIVSGRPIAQIDVLLGPLRLPAAGVHGAQRRDAQGHMYSAGGQVPVALRRACADLVARFPNVWLEQKPGALALHYRAAPQAGPMCGYVLREVIADHAAWELIGGKCVWEIKPGESSKASAVDAFLLEPPFKDRVPVFCGDDETDEDGFLAARVHGGFGLKVDGDTSLASAAEYRVPTTAALTRWLRESIKMGINARVKTGNNEPKGAPR